MYIKLSQTLGDLIEYVVESCGSGCPPSLLNDSDDVSYTLSYAFSPHSSAYMYWCVVTKKSSKSGPCRMRHIF